MPQASRTLQWFQEHKMIVLIPLLLLVILCVVVFVAFTPRDRSVLFGREKQFTHNSSERTYRISLPQEVTESSKLIVGLHGFSDSARRFAYYSGLHNAAGTHDIVLYPQAIDPRGDGFKKGWNAGFCCGSGWNNKIDDAGFIVALVQHITQIHGVNPDNVYATGFSNGAFMTQRLATDYPDMFRAIAPHSGSIGTDTKQLSPQKPVPILLLHGEKDKIVPFNGGPGSSDSSFTWRPFAETVAVWEAVNDSTAPTETRTYPKDRHAWHGWRLFKFWKQTPQASKEVLKFFNDQP